MEEQSAQIHAPLLSKLITRIRAVLTLIRGIQNRWKFLLWSCFYFLVLALMLTHFVFQNDSEGEEESIKRSIVEMKDKSAQFEILNRLSSGENVNVSTNFFKSYVIRKEIRGFREITKNLLVTDRDGQIVVLSCDEGAMYLHKKDDFWERVNEPFVSKISYVEVMRWGFYAYTEDSIYKCKINDSELTIHPVTHRNFEDGLEAYATDLGVIQVNSSGQPDTLLANGDKISIPDNVNRDLIDIFNGELMYWDFSSSEVKLRSLKKNLDKDLNSLKTTRRLRQVATPVRIEDHLFLIGRKGVESYQLGNTGYLEGTILFEGDSGAILPVNDGAGFLFGNDSCYYLATVTSNLSKSLQPHDGSYGIIEQLKTLIVNAATTLYKADDLLVYDEFSDTLGGVLINTKENIANSIKFRYKTSHQPILQRADLELITTRGQGLYVNPYGVFDFDIGDDGLVTANIIGKVNWGKGKSFDIIERKVNNALLVWVAFFALLFYLAVLTFIWGTFNHPTSEFITSSVKVNVTLSGHVIRDIEAELDNLLIRKEVMLWAGILIGAAGIALFYFLIEGQINALTLSGNSSQFTRKDIFNFIRPISMLIFCESFTFYFLKQYRVIYQEYKIFYSIYLRYLALFQASEIVSDTQLEELKKRLSEQLLAFDFSQLHGLNTEKIREFDGTPLKDTLDKIADKVGVK